MKLIVGLGNPGKEYDDTRHNVGFMAVDRLREKFDLPDFKLLKPYAWISEGFVNQEKVFLIKPISFMNRSGEVVQYFSNKYKVAPNDVLIIYDDVDLPLGTIRYREVGSAGTHNGMKSVIQHLGTIEVPRLRIGIENRSHPHFDGHGESIDLARYVLASFFEDEYELLGRAFAQVEEKIKNLLP
jgi:PTH1 family peptidyl-tRNA hydrolase